MLLTRKNPVAGRGLGNRFPIDEENGQIGFKIGYCPCGEKVLIKSSDAKLIANNFATILPAYEEYLNKIKDIKPILPFKLRIIKALGGTMEDI